MPRKWEKHLLIKQTADRRRGEEQTGFNESQLKIICGFNRGLEMFYECVKCASWIGIWTIIKNVDRYEQM